MYDYIKGKITNLLPNSIIIECNNIGYVAKIPNPLEYNLYQDKTIYIYQYIKDNTHELYGLINKDIRQLFIMLINVKGLGPKNALSILSINNIEEIIEAINNNNPSFFQQFSGIGTKIAHQIILDLNNKFKNKINPKN